MITSLALINATAGGILLVLPIVGLDAGWLMIPIITCISSAACYYTAIIMFRHLGNHTTINQMIMSHFKNEKYCYFYNITMFLSFVGQILLYFDLLISQTKGIFHFLSEHIKYYFPYYTALFLIILVLLCRYFQFEDQLLFYGITSILAFTVFIIWILINRKKGFRIFHPINRNFIDLGATMSQGLSIHNMMIPVILRSKDPKNYNKILLNVFVIAGLLYTFFAYGAYALVNRHPLPETQGQTVQDYFSSKQWQIYLLRIIYIINIVTVIPQFLSISRIRFFNIFSQQQPRQAPISKKQVAYYCTIIGICLIAKILHLRAQTIIYLNGAIICFLQIYLIPLILHLKCIWWDYQQEQFGVNEQKEQNKFNFGNNCQLKEVQNNQFHKIQSDPEAQVPNQNQKISEQDHVKLKQPEKCLCIKQMDQKINSKKRLYQIIISFLVLAWGFFVMFYTIMIFFNRKK